MWAWDLYHSTALDEAAKDLAPTSAKNGGKVAYCSFMYIVYGIPNYKPAQSAQFYHAIFA